MFPRGTRVTVPNPDGEGSVAATFQEVDPSRPGEIDDAKYEGGVRRFDQAWILYAEGDLEGTTGLVPCRSIKAAE